MEDPRNKLAFFYEDSYHYVEAFLNAFKKIAVAEGFSISQLALYWSLTRPWMDTVLVGARNRTQIEENITSLNIHPEPEVMSEITALSDNLYKNMPGRDNIFNHNPAGQT